MKQSQLYINDSTNRISSEIPTGSWDNAHIQRLIFIIVVQGTTETDNITIIKSILEGHLNEAINIIQTG